eukprot:scaffold120175_cov57-Attheya_sp.AAC.1
MFVAGSAGSGYCLRSARVRRKMQVARELEGLRSAGLRPPGWIDMDRCVHHRRGLARGADIGGPVFTREHRLVPVLYQPRLPGTT